MDRRTRKTHAAIVEAYKKLLKETGADISVRRIIELADIGRSTFYVHFSDKSGLPREIFEQLFIHVGTETGIAPPGVSPQEREAIGLLYEKAPEKWKLERLFVHLMKHMEREKAIYARLFDSEGAGWFRYDFRGCFARFLRAYVLEKLAPVPEDIPEELYLSHMMDSFFTIVGWAYSQKGPCPPQDLGRFYMVLTFGGG